MTREEKKKELTDLFLNSALTFGEVIDEAFEFADEYPQDWISVEDELPKKENGYLVSDGTGVLFGYWVDGFWMPSKLSGDITHWMPLPQPPKGGEQ